MEKKTYRVTAGCRVNGIVYRKGTVDLEPKDIKGIEDCLQEVDVKAEAAAAKAKAKAEAEAAEAKAKAEAGK